MATRPLADDAPMIRTVKSFGKFVVLPFKAIHEDMAGLRVPAICRASAPSGTGYSDDLGMFTYSISEPEVKLTKYHLWPSLAVPTPSMPGTCGSESAE